MAGKLAEEVKPSDEQAFDNAELKHARADYIMSLPDEVRNKTFDALAGMSQEQQNVVWDQMRENQNQQWQQQVGAEPSM